MNTRPSAPPQRIVPGEAAAWLHDARASRDIEAAALARHAPHALMQRAGLAVARLALAVAPHARRVWIACGPGNNGGDGLIAARHLLRAGLGLHVTLCGDAARLPEDARRALLLGLLNDARPLRVMGAAYSAHTQGEIAIFETALRLRQRYGAEAIRHCIISHTETVSDLLEVLLLQKEVGLTRGLLAQNAVADLIVVREEEIRG